MLKGGKYPTNPKFCIWKFFSKERKENHTRFRLDSKQLQSQHSQAKQEGHEFKASLGYVERDFINMVSKYDSEVCKIISTGITYMCIMWVCLYVCTYEWRKK